jgi:hypothetical protein
MLLDLPALRLKVDRNRGSESSGRSSHAREESGEPSTKTAAPGEEKAPARSCDDEPSRCGCSQCECGEGSAAASGSGYSMIPEEGEGPEGEGAEGEGPPQSLTKGGDHELCTLSWLPVKGPW